MYVSFVFYIRPQNETHRNALVTYTYFINAQTPHTIGSQPIELFSIHTPLQLTHIV